MLSAQQPLRRTEICSHTPFFLSRASVLVEGAAARGGWESFPHARRCRTGASVRRAGFTVIEMLAAASLATMMVVLSLGVISSLSVRQRALATSDPHAWRSILIDQVRWEAMNAETLLELENGARLTGLVGTDWTTGQPTHRPASISYFVERRGDRNCLIRRETHLDEPAMQNAREDLVCVGVSRFSLRSPLVARQVQQRAVPVPLTGYVTLQAWDDEAMLILDETIRWE